MLERLTRIIYTDHNCLSISYTHHHNPIMPTKTKLRVFMQTDGDVPLQDWYRVLNRHTECLYMGLFRSGKTTYLYIQTKTATCSKRILRTLFPSGWLSKCGNRIIPTLKFKHRVMKVDGFETIEGERVEEIGKIQTRNFYEEDRAFRAVWDTFNGVWYPVAWIGPIGNLVASERCLTSVQNVRDLLQDQKNACKVCLAAVHRGEGSNCDVDHVLPLCLGGNNGIDNLQILCVEDHRRKTSFESQKVSSYPVDNNIELEKGVAYIVRGHINTMPTEILSKTVKQALREPPGIFKLVTSIN